jgi:hypothetical protein
MKHVTVEGVLLDEVALKELDDINRGDGDFILQDLDELMSYIFAKMDCEIEVDPKAVSLLRKVNELKQIFRGLYVAKRGGEPCQK